MAGAEAAEAEPIPGAVDTSRTLGELAEVLGPEKAMAVVGSLAVVVVVVDTELPRTFFRQ